jgi:hypothetical protein
MRLEKAFAVIGAVVVLFAATDALTYAATGSSLVLGKINAANATTTIQNTGTAPALKLLTKSTATAPMAVNGKGRVVNLYADRAATADNASKLGGKTVAQIVSSATPHLSGVIWVAKAGGQFTSVNAALASITDNGPAHPYVIMVAPGTYTETTPIIVKTFVDIQGSGRNRTTLFCGCHGANLANDATVFEKTAVDAEIRDLTITNNHTASADAYAVFVDAPTPTFSLVHVSLTALATGTSGLGIGLFVNGGSAGPHLDDVNAYVVGSPGGNYGVYLDAPTIVRNSWIYTSGTSVYSFGSNSWLIGSTVVGPTSHFTGRCTAVVNVDGSPYTCA